MQLEDLNKSVETALSAFNEYKGMVEGFKTKLNTIEPKLDALDMSKLNKMSDDIGKAIEESQAVNAKLAAVENQQKALETAMNRVPAGDAKNSDEKAKELAAKRNKLFNDFARSREDDANKEYFDSYLRKAVKDEAEYKAMAISSEPNGGYLTIPEFGGVIQTKIFETSPIRQLATTMTIGTDTFEVVIDSDQAASGWVGEVQQPRSDTVTPVLGKLQITVNELYAQPKASQKLLEDAIIDVEAWLADKVTQIFSRTENTAFVTGSGVLQPKGILSYAAGTDITQQQIQQVVTGNASGFTYAGLVNLQASLKEDYQSNSTFLIQRASIANLMTITDGMGRPIFNLLFDRNAGLERTIMGQPLYFANDVPAVATNALAMIYGDFRRAYQIVDRTGVRVLRDPFTDKPNVRFYTTKRTGGGVVNFESIKIQQIHT